MSASWEQTRDLCVISVAEDAFDTLIYKSGLKVGQGKARKPPVQVDDDSNASLANGLARLRTTSAQRNLLATVSQVARYVDGTIEPSQRECWFKESDVLIWELVNTYKNHKAGDLEPELPFFHISISHETQVVNTEDEDPIEFIHSVTLGSFDPDDEFTEPLLNGDLEISDAGVILIHGGANTREGRSPSDLCVYIVHGSTQTPNQDELTRMIKTAFVDRDVYHTTRDNGTLNLHDSKPRLTWNIKKSYGVFFSYGRESFVKWLRHWNKPLPERQGSPRGATDSGRLIFEREYSPWHDPRGLYGGPLAEKKEEILKELFRMEVTAWAHIAREKTRQGTICCVLCSENGDYRMEDDDEEYRYCRKFGFISGLCDEWQEQSDISIGYGFPVWTKRLPRKALKKAISSASPTPTQDLVSQDAYCQILMNQTACRMNYLRELLRILLTQKGQPLV
ncbi:hypothetical protein F5Y00DRAFT_234096 [Daldinia vernicosa]|uniref:uncharacterized protein n=1 Tax=Daldinia vernicosa TaxID=114800 RepID=UPI0020080F0E|nr:uncharacterized protein F5Y00DRAFT_234096 [Daldinia vernicosa]KAI0849890.1 hypothetical protein F5Y00DRAFT_234096 [Daldinia vernicosa]